MDERDIRALEEAVRDGIREGMEPLREFVETCERMFKCIHELAEKLDRRSKERADAETR